MAAWNHTRYWNESLYRQYRLFVKQKAPLYKSRTDDCADLSMRLLIDFASERGLPLTFTDNAGYLYISKGTREVRSTGFGIPPKEYIRTGVLPPRPLFQKSWNDKKSYTEAVLRRIGSKALFEENTVWNMHGPEEGDLLSKSDHTAIVFNVFKPGQIHPKWDDQKVLDFPGNDTAARQLNVLEYFRDVESRRQSLIGSTIHFDYLNHRGWGKEQAELIYYANVWDPDFKEFEFRKFAPRVIQNWEHWNGYDAPPGFQ